MKRSIVLTSSCASVLLAACSLDLRSNPAYCESDSDCDPGQTCARDPGESAGLCAGDRLDGSAGDGGSCVENAPCYTGPEETRGMGVCADGALQCRGALAICAGETTPSADDSCDGVDQDCDGEEDDDFTPSVDCAIEAPGVCANGRYNCVGGELRCMPVVEATAERCNRMDDDCDAVTDEDTDAPCYPPAAPRGCTAMPDGTFLCTGACFTGRLLCDEAGTMSCVGATTPTDDDPCTVGGGTAFDDDCDGSIDEDCAMSCADDRDCYPGPASAAGVGACLLGAQTCTGGSFGPCEGATLPAAETCTNAASDDDCNGIADDIDGLGESCLDEEALGVCRMGELMCGGAELACVTPDSVEETCDGRDDDCDGFVDEDFDLSTNEDHCGRCGRSCGSGLTCCAGECIDTSSDPLNCNSCATACDAESQGCCGSACMDVLSDRMNCGECGNVCPGEQICCGGACFDPRSDEAHCGDCATACTGGDDCCDGMCADPLSTQCTDCTMDCTGEETCCAPSCTDTESDPANCGGCGTECAAGESCCGGDCSNASVDEANCGGCGMACGGATDTCCGSGCVDIESDTAHCGGCGEACDTGELCCDGACVDPESNAMNCGMCERDCTAVAQLCSNGNCCPAGQTFCEVGAVGCADLIADEDHCGVCGRECSPGQTCCSGNCVDTENDEMHCGGCGDVCTDPEESTCCDSECVDLGESEQHCLACGIACGPAQTCCPNGCKSMQTDPDNCGGCGIECNAAQVCCRGSCVAILTCL